MIETIKDTIDSRYHLKRTGRSWMIGESLEIKLTAPNRYSFGFSLDHQHHPPLAFFSGEPPTHLAKMCDAIITLKRNNELYLFCIEVKTAHKNSYEKQLANGRIFCDWLIALYKRHDHWKIGSVYILGVLIWQPREKAVRKGTTSHRHNGSIQEVNSRDFDSAFHIANRAPIHLCDLLRKLRIATNSSEAV